MAHQVRTESMKNKLLLSIPRGKARELIAFCLIGIALLTFVQGCKKSEDTGVKEKGVVTDQLFKPQVSIPCGKFACLNHKALDPRTNLGADYKVEFQFQPKDCSKDCLCERIAYVQIARVVLSNGTIYDDGFHTPLMVTNITDGSGEESLELNGWFIDQWFETQTGAFAKYGYYGRFDDGTFSTKDVVLGQNKRSPEVAARLSDTPTGMPKGSQVEFIDIPVCLDISASCNDKLLGYSNWWFRIGNEEGTPSIDGPDFDLVPNDERLKDLKKAVHLAMTRWNDNAPSNGPETEKFPNNMIALDNP